MDENDNTCPRGCEGELETAYGHIYTDDGGTYFKVSVTYCPRCKCVCSTEAHL